MYLLKSAGLFVMFCLLATLVSCSNEVGSKEWCEDMKQKPKADWTAKEAANYAKHCLIR